MSTHVDADILKATMRRHGICVVIPTFNNAATLTGVIDGVLAHCSDVIVVNDGSTDATAVLLAGYADRVDTVSYPANRGKGHALRCGFEHALRRGFTYAITIDSDGQHYPTDIPLFVEAIVAHPGALIIGERDLSGVDINGKSSFANKFSNFWFCVQTGRRLRDTQTGYRAYPLNRLHGLRLLTSRYEAELELLVFAAWHGVALVPIPISVYYPPQAERVSHFRPALDFTRISLLNTVLCFAAVLYGAPSILLHAIGRRRLFSREWRCFTRRHGTPKDAATTLGRIARSIFGFGYFLIMLAVFSPFVWAFSAMRNPGESHRMRLHRIIRRFSRMLVKRFPGARTTYENPSREEFSRPAVVVCNHQSQLDLPVLMALHPRLVFLTNDWVWNNFFIGRLVHTAEFLPVSAGIDNIMPQLRSLRDRGYSIVVFPEGTRSADCSILRFHQGAFMLARELQMDIVPMVLHGAGHYLPKHDMLFRRGAITLRILPRHSFSDRPADLTLRKEASAMRRLIADEYRSIASKKELTAYFRSLVLYKYAWRGWDTVARCKATLRRINRLAPVIDSERPDVRAVRIINSGIGVFALLYALVNKDVQVYAFEECEADHAIASATPHLPANLHLLRPVWHSDYTTMLPDGAQIDKTYLLPGHATGGFTGFTPVTVTM